MTYDDAYKQWLIQKILSGHTDYTYGPGSPDPTRADMSQKIGATDNKLRTGDIALPHEDYKLFTPEEREKYRIADTSWIKPGTPTPRGSVERYFGANYADDRKDLLRDTDNIFYGGGQSPMPTPTPTATPRVADNSWQPYAGALTSPDGLSVPGFQGQGIAESGVTPSTWSAYAAPVASPSSKFASSIGTALSGLGKGIEQQGQQGMQQALAMLQRDPRAAAALQQFANNPWAYLTPIALGGT